MKTIFCDIRKVKKGIILASIRGNICIHIHSYIYNYLQWPDYPKIEKLNIRKDTVKREGHLRLDYLHLRTLR